jgi:hypothetical protein
MLKNNNIINNKHRHHQLKKFESKKGISQVLLNILYYYMFLGNRRPSPIKK